MNSAISLNDMIGVADMNNRIVDAVLQAFKNVGGNEADILRFMDTSDIEGAQRRIALRALAKNVINERLWNIADRQVQIGGVDYRATPEELGKRHGLAVRIDLPQGNRHEDQAMCGDFHYTLRHEDRHETLWGIAKTYANNGVPVANWRELLVYGAHLRLDNIDLKGYEIFALSSPFLPAGSAASYPRLRMEEGKIVFVWESLEDFPPVSRRRFYLVRHSSASST